MTTHLEGRIDSLEVRFEKTSEALFGKLDKVTDVVSGLATEVKRQGTEMRSRQGPSLFLVIGGGAGLVTIIGGLAVLASFFVDGRVRTGMEAQRLNHEHVAEMTRLKLEHQAEVTNLRLNRLENATRWTAGWKPSVE